MKFYQILFYVFFLMSSNSAFAQITQVKDDSGKVLFTLSDFARDNTGVVHTTIYEATDYCLRLDPSHNSRLPTIRELAQYAHYLGAVGITGNFTQNQTVGSNQRCDNDSWSVSASDKDQFCFNKNGYQRPTGDLASHRVWSSSPYYFQPRFSNFPNFGYDFDGYNANVGYMSFYSLDAVRCVVGQ